MFLKFFYTLRYFRVPVSVIEWMTLMEALLKGYAKSNLTNFYFLARAILVKNNSYYDQYDQAFSYVFRGVKLSINIRQEVIDWLEESLAHLSLNIDKLNYIKALELDDLKVELENRLQQQTTRHDGGSYWIGTRGSSPFGNSGVNPLGIRIGNSDIRRSQAVQIASARYFRNYRTDLLLDVRQVKVILKKLRQFSREGLAEELDINATVDKTCREGGELELVFSRERRNAVKLLLFMDSGGSMSPYTRLVNQIFSAAHQMNHFRDLKAYFFHNCIYQDVYKDIANNKTEPTRVLLSTLNGDYRVIFVGDAYMASSELFAIGGAIDYYYYNDKPGIEWLKFIIDHFQYCIWLNPLPERLWGHLTIKAISDIIPMFPLTLEGLEKGIKKLIIKNNY